MAQGSEDTAPESTRKGFPGMPRSLSGPRRIKPLPPSAHGDPQAAFTQSPFAKLATTHLISMAGDALITMALAGSLFFDISPKAARGRVALSLLFTIAPFAVVAPLLGPIIDRTKGGRRLMVVVSLAGRAVCCLLMAREIHSLLLFPSALATLILSKGYIVAKASLVPTAIEDPEHLVEANSKLAVGGAIVGLLAGIPGVAILQLLGGRALLRFDTLVMLVGAVTALRIVPARRPVAPPPDVLDLGGPPAMATGTATGAATGAGAGVTAPAGVTGPTGPPEAPTLIRATEAQERLGTGILLAAGAIANLRFTVGFLTFLIAFAFRRGHAAPWWYGLVLACSLGGNLLGSAVAPFLRSRLREQWIITGSLGFVALVAFSSGSLRMFEHRPAAALLGLAVGSGAGAAKIAFDALVQQDAPSSIQSRAFARFEAAFQLVWVVGGLMPVAFTMSLTLGFMVITLLALGTLISYAVLAWMSDHGRLPGWFPRAWVKALSVPTARAEEA